jgi:D-xylose transport system substrate-binding protein
VSRTRFARFAAVAAVCGVALGACGGDDDSSSDDTTAAPAASDAVTTAPAATGGGKIGVILPDSASSARWETADRPFLEAAIKAAGFEPIIQNAEGDKQKMATIAESMIAEKVAVLMIVNLDSDSGKTILQKAKDAGIATVDYDRLTLGGGADVYISFDNVAVGKLQGEGLEKCIADKGIEEPKVVELNGSPTDNNATLFKEGYDSVLDPLYETGGWTKVDDQSVPDWDNQTGGQIFEQMLATAGGSVDGVLAANDGLAGAVIAVLKKNNLQVPVTGQDATVDGLRSILTGDQCMTVYKAVKTEAEAAAQAAIELAQGKPPTTNGTVTDTETGTEVPSVLATPVAIYFDNVKDVIADGYVTKDDVCKDLADECSAAGIS